MSSENVFSAMNEVHKLTLKSMCPMRAFYSQRVTKKRISFDSQKNAPPFFCLFAERTHRSAFLFSGFVR